MKELLRLKKKNNKIISYDSTYYIYYLERNNKVAMEFNENKIYKFIYNKSGRIEKITTGSNELVRKFIYNETGRIEEELLFSSKNSLKTLTKYSYSNDLLQMQRTYNDKGELLYWILIKQN